jgi:hypothetical protein
MPWPCGLVVMKSDEVKAAEVIVTAIPKEGVYSVAAPASSVS